MAKNDRATTTDTPAPTPVRISYIHPVDLLLERLQNALVAVSALPYGWESSDSDHRTYGEKYLDPAHRAIELARGVAFGVGKSLRFGMGDLAGVTETKLRTDLDALYIGAYKVSRNAPPVVKRRCWDAYDRLEQLSTELARVAIEPEPIAWPKKLRGFYHALLRVKDGMRTLYEAAEDDASDPVELWKQVCRTVLPDFSEVAADILPQLVYAAEADGSGDLYLDRFPDHVFNCCQELMCWGTHRRERPKEDIRFEPSHEYRAARADREALLWWLKNAPEAVEAEPSSEGKKSAAQLAGAVPEGANVPIWDEDRRELRLGNNVCKSYTRAPSPNQIAIIKAFQECEWPTKIDDPLPPRANLNTKKRLHNTITDLNNGMGLIKFRGDGTGEAVIWEFCRPQ